MIFARALVRRFAVFDIDGTLIRWQLYHVIVDRLAKEGQLGDDALERLHEARMRWKKREHSNAFSEYESQLVAIFEDSLAQVSPKQFDALIQGVIEEYKEQVYVFTRDLIKQLKQQGYVLLAISGSHHELVGEIAKFYGFNDWIGTTYERSGSRYSGQAFVASHHKKKLLQSLIKKHRLTTEGSYAIGDSKSDAPMLELVEQPIAFNPDKNLFQIAHQQHWDIVVERKNMIYQLEYNNGHYVLAEAGE